MPDENYWKNLYKDTWQKSDQRERAVIERIRKDTGRIVVAAGLGAGSTEYLPGSAARRGHEKGGADLQVADTNIYLEVTGPQTTRVRRTDPLWVRPDKVENAREHYPEHETWVVHWLERDGTLRVINLDDNFFRELDRGVLPIEAKYTGRARERYVEIPATHACVRPWSDLIDRLRNL